MLNLFFGSKHGNIVTVPDSAHVTVKRIQFDDDIESTQLLSTPRRKSIPYTPVTPSTATSSISGDSPIPFSMHTPAAKRLHKLGVCSTKLTDTMSNWKEIKRIMVDTMSPIIIIYTVHADSQVEIANCGGFMSPLSPSKTVVTTSQTFDFEMVKAQIQHDVSTAATFMRSAMSHDTITRLRLSTATPFEMWNKLGEEYVKKIYRYNMDTRCRSITLQ